MTGSPRRRRHPWCLAWLAMLGLAAGCRSEPEPVAPRPASVPRLVALESGSEGGEGPPPGWSHRVIRSVPRLASGDLDELPDAAGDTATRFRTVVAAEVAGSRRLGFHLARVGVGNAVPTPDGERVVTLDGPPRVLETLGVVDRVVLIARISSSTAAPRRPIPTFALFRTPTMLLVDGEHRDVDLCYALLVDPSTGALSALCWPLPPGCASPPDALTLLPPDLAFDAPLDARATVASAPSSSPGPSPSPAPLPGRRIPVPVALAPALFPARRPRGDGSGPSEASRPRRTALDDPASQPTSSARPDGRSEPQEIGVLVVVPRGTPNGIAWMACQGNKAWVAEVGRAGRYRTRRTGPTRRGRPAPATPKVNLLGKPELIRVT